MTDISDYVAVHEAHPVRDEGTVVIFEGVIVDDETDSFETVWFAVDHSAARHLAGVAEDGVVLLVEPWQVLAKTAPLHRDGVEGWEPDYEGPFDEERAIQAAETRYEAEIDGWFPF